MTSSTANVALPDAAEQLFGSIELEPSTFATAATTTSAASTSATLWNHVSQTSKIGARFSVWW